jgi:hypothetical protein
MEDPKALDEGPATVVIPPLEAVLCWAQRLVPTLVAQGRAFLERFPLLIIRENATVRLHTLNIFLNPTSFQLGRFSDQRGSVVLKALIRFPKKKKKNCLCKMNIAYVRRRNLRLYEAVKP